MPRSSLFANDEKKAEIRAWFKVFRCKIPGVTESVTFKTSFGTTHALIAGAVDAPPLILLHGALASSAHALSEMGDLLRTRRVYALDVIGQSVMSEDRRLNLRDDSYAQWLFEAANSLGLDRFALYGVSWGGFVATRAAALDSARLSHLILMVPAGWVGNSAWAGFRDAGWPLMRYKLAPSRPNLVRFVDAIYSTLDEDWLNYFGDALRCYRFDTRIPPLVKAADVAGVKCPTLAFGAELDSQFPGKPLVDRVKKLLPDAEVELLEGSKHCPPLTDEFRAWMSQRVGRFLDGGSEVGHTF